MSAFVVKINKNDIAKTANMAKTLLKVANSLTKNVSSNKIITDTKKSEKNERKDRGRSLDAKRMARGAGILLAITSLPSSYGIGTLGDAPFQFIDLLVDLKQKYWQVLPVGPTGYGDSPYQPISGCAGNIYFIDLDRLVDEGLLERSEILEYNWGTDKSEVDYEKIYHGRRSILQKAFERFDTNAQDFREFKEKHSEWLGDYGLFMALKN